MPSGGLQPLLCISVSAMSVNEQEWLKRAMDVCALSYPFAWLVGWLLSRRY